MALDFLKKEPSLQWTEDNQLCDHFKAWRKSIRMLMTSMVLRKEPQEFICHSIKTWLRGWATHSEAGGLMGDNANSMKCILNAIKSHCKPRSNKIVAAMAYIQLVQGDLGMPQYLEKYKKSHQCATFTQHMINAYEMQY